MCLNLCSNDELAASLNEAARVIRLAPHHHYCSTSESPGLIILAHPPVDNSSLLRKALCQLDWVDCRVEHDDGARVDQVLVAINADTIADLQHIERRG